MFKSCQKESIPIIQKDICCEMRKSEKTFSNSSKQLSKLNVAQQPYKEFSKLNVVQQPYKECLEELHNSLRNFMSPVIQKYRSDL